MLAAISCFFNPSGYRKPVENFLRFQESLRGVDLFTIEASYNGESVVPNATMRIRCGEEHLMWQKERMLNLLLDELPPKYDTVAWLDGDILFMDPRWAMKAEKLLEQYSVIQLFSNGHHLDALGCVFLSGSSCVRHRKEKADSESVRGGFSGFAWAARRDVLLGGFYDAHIVGANDYLMYLGWNGEEHHNIDEVFSPAAQLHLRAWSADAYRQVQGDCGYLKGDIVHLYHGSLNDRRYRRRCRVLLDNAFDPETDIAIDANGLWRFASDKPRLRHGIRRYFRSRREDSPG